MKISFPSMGIYTKPILKLKEYLGWDIIEPIKPTTRVIEAGAKHMHELMCLPAKVGLGQFIDACEHGADTLLMFDSCGECRLKSYWILQTRALKQLGYNATVFPIRLGKHTATDIKRIDPRITYLRAWTAFIKTLHDVYRLDSASPSENGKVKIGIVGEIFTVLEPEINYNIVAKLKKLGVATHISLSLSFFIFKDWYKRGWLKRKGIDYALWTKAYRLAHSYFPKEIGGHGNESLANTIYYALSGYDGVLHLMPFPCMPEATVASVMDEIHRDFNIPVMRLIFDVQSGEAGLITRLEAFVDMLERRKNVVD